MSGPRETCPGWRLCLGGGGEEVWGGSWENPRGGGESISGNGRVLFGGIEEDPPGHWRKSVVGNRGLVLGMGDLD